MLTNQLLNNNNSNFYSVVLQGAAVEHILGEHANLKVNTGPDPSNKGLQLSPLRPSSIIRKFDSERLQLGQSRRPHLAMRCGRTDSIVIVHPIQQVVTMPNFGQLYPYLPPSLNQLGLCICYLWGW